MPFGLLDLPLHEHDVPDLIDRQRVVRVGFEALLKRRERFVIAPQPPLQLTDRELKTPQRRSEREGGLILLDGSLQIT